ncbi:MAG: MotA/TolQ/ExbB proton channel family protein [Kiritimatiellae bacterium]|jgi:biopolymer transport protein ExbB|nr:MotA/TolQ/ExbB proton channel family protein [Kiritimatiellia bacterium]
MKKLMMLSLMFVSIVVQAQEAVKPVVGDAAKMSWRQVLENGGIMMYILGVVSILTLAFIVYLFAVMRVGMIVPRSLYREVMESVRLGYYDQARKACEDKKNAFAAITLTAMDYVETVPNYDNQMLKDTVEGEGGRQAAKLQGTPQILMDVGAIAPMLGLLGTVFGMLTAFTGIALDIAQARPVVLAEGVSMALITTAAGLIVGIPAMAFYSYFRTRSAKLIAVLEGVSADLLTGIMSSK